jgi:hypothetical protein
LLVRQTLVSGGETVEKRFDQLGREGRLCERHRRVTESDNRFDKSASRVEMPTPGCRVQTSKRRTAEQAPERRQHLGDQLILPGRILRCLPAGHGEKEVQRDCEGETGAA